MSDGNDALSALLQQSLSNPAVNDPAGGSPFSAVAPPPNTPAPPPETQNAPITGELQEPAQAQNLPQIAPQQPQRQPPQMGGTPLIARYLMDVIRGPKNVQDPNTGVISQQSRGDQTLNFLGEFLGNMAAGFQQAGHGPGANLRGAGAAMMAPYQRALQNYQLGQQQQAFQSQQALQQAQAAQYQQQQVPLFNQDGTQATNADGTPATIPIQQKDVGRYMQAAQSAAISGKAKEVAAGTQKRFLPTAYGLYDTQDRKFVGGGNGVQVTKEIADDYGMPKEMIGQTVTPTQLASLERANAIGTGTVMGAAGPALVTKVGPNRGQTQSLGLGNPGVAARMAGPVQVADPDSPGNTKWMTAGNAEKLGMGGPTSASVTVPKKVQEWATSGKGGEEINAFNTAVQHADLLEKAAVAMHNGDQRTLNGIKNAFKTEFGSSDVTNFQTIASAYNREIIKMLSSGHMTDQELTEQGAKLPSNASDEQIYGAINTYRALANSKMQMRYNQYQQGVQGKPNFPSSIKGGAGSNKVDALVNKYLTGAKPSGQQP